MKIIIATNNQGKVKEFKRILSADNYTVLSLNDVQWHQAIEETGSTFAENAKIKAWTIYNELKLPVIADDSGLCVDALNGAPGIYSARYSGKNATDQSNIDKLLTEMKKQTNRMARFVCALCYIDKNGQEHLLQDTCEGEIGTKPVGENGFGYDPVFMVGAKSFAQLTDAEKDTCSHRGKVLKKFQDMIIKENVI